MKNRLLYTTLMACFWTATCTAQLDITQDQPQLPAAQPKPEASPIPAEKPAVEKPTAEKPGEKITVRRVTVALVDGSLLVGVVPAEIVFPVNTEEVKADIAIKWVSTITFTKDRKTAKFEMENGDHVNGVLSMKTLPLKTAFGDLALDWNSIRTVNVMDEEASQEGLVFWNTLASDEDLRRSVVGPALLPYTNQEPPETSGQETIKGTVGDREFIKGTRSGTVTIKGTYQPQNLVHNLVLTGLNKLINPEEGCIEFWYCQRERPMANRYGIYRMFDGDHGLGSCVQCFTTPDKIQFALDCGGERVVVNCPMENVPDKEWLHLAVTWNRKGIEGAQDTVRLYLNGKKIVASTVADWGTTAGGMADICGANDDQCARKFLMSGLKIWNHSKTSFTMKAPDIDAKSIQPPEQEQEIWRLEGMLRD